MSAANKDLKAGVMFYGGGTMVPFGEGPSPFDRTREISCPIQGHFGAEDQNPSPDRHAQARRRAYEMGKAPRVPHLCRRGPRICQFGLKQLPAPCSSPVVAQSDGIFQQAFGGMKPGR